MSTTQPIHLSPFLERVRDVLPEGVPVHLVGGAIRDALLGRAVHDLDFVLPHSAVKVARQVADSLNAAFYVLDKERETGRIITGQPDGTRVVLDFSVYQGPDLESDLRGRDFTINAIAVAVDQPQVLLDPLGGAGDLRAKQLRACSPVSIEADPVRIIRGIRLATALNFRILPGTRKQMLRAAPLLRRSSAERRRDELFRILNGRRVAMALRALDILGVLPNLLPELETLKGVTQSPPHIHDVWDHSLDVVQKLEHVLEVLAANYDPETSASLHMGLLTLRIGRYRNQIKAHLEEPLVPGRPVRPLLFLAALYHDIGKSATRQREEDGRIRFFRHDQVGAKIIAERARSLQLSNAEGLRLRAIVRHHLRPKLLAQTGKPPTRRAIYRFFRDTGLAGVDVCLLSLADVLGTFGATLPHENWAHHLDIVRALLESWWEHPEQSVSPPYLLNGRDLISEFNLSPGIEIGRLLDAIREAQAAGLVHTREEAISFARNLLQETQR